MSNSLKKLVLTWLLLMFSTAGFAQGPREVLAYVAEHGVGFYEASRAVGLVPEDVADALGYDSVFEAAREAPMAGVNCYVEFVSLRGAAAEHGVDRTSLRDRFAGGLADFAPGLRKCEADDRTGLWIELEVWAVGAGRPVVAFHAEAQVHILREDQTASGLAGVPAFEQAWLMPLDLSTERVIVRSQAELFVDLLAADLAHRYVRAQPW